MSKPTSRFVLSTIAALGAGAAIAAAVSADGAASAQQGPRATAAQAGTGSDVAWLQSTAGSTELDSRSFVEILGSATQPGQPAAHAVTVRAVARIVPKPGSTTQGTIDVICELVERPAQHVIDRVQVTARPRQRVTMLSTSVAILNPGGSVRWRCRQQRRSSTHLVRLEHGRLVDLVIGNGSKVGPEVS